MDIAEEKELCQEYMGKFSVISISLKDADFTNYEVVREMLCSILGREALRFSFLEKSEQLSNQERDTVIFW